MAMITPQLAASRGLGSDLIDYALDTATGGAKYEEPAKKPEQLIPGIDNTILIGGVAAVVVLYLARN